jgi:hypothetical protein
LARFGIRFLTIPIYGVKILDVLHSKKPIQ